MDTAPPSQLHQGAKSSYSLAANNPDQLARRFDFNRVLGCSGKVFNAPAEH